MQPRRQQQQSILSFLQKQPPRRDPAGEGTTPEKPPRPPAGSVAGIMERLVRPPPLPQPQGRNKDASRVRHAEKATSVKNQVPSNERSTPLFSRPCNVEYSKVTLFPEQSSDMTPLQEPLKHLLRSSVDEFVRARTLFGSNQTPLQEHPKKLFSEFPNNSCIRATSLFEEFDVQTPSQDPSKRIFLGPSHGADTPLTEYGSDQTLLQHSSKKFSLISANGEYARAATAFGLDSNDTCTEEPSKKLSSGSSDPFYIKATNLFAELDSNATPSQNHLKNVSSVLMNDKHVAAVTLFPALDSSPSKPETPAMQAAIPRPKRVREEQSATADNQPSPLRVLNKKMKSSHCSPIGKKVHDEIAESARSKFEWLNLYTIRDANGRRPNDPLYDKSTLFIPPDALRKMSTSQKQYWNIKCKYMDVVLFFKVGKFYELYELDAEIGQKELDWKMTVSGVGKCRQVGISESGIDDAVDKLVARGYKVGRIEQMESADQAKARGSNTVIERKLVQVCTPSTVADSNIGPDAVHLLALKEVTLASSGSRVYGFAFLDYAALKIWVGSLHDDDSSAALGALLVQVSPREIIYETSGLSKETHISMRKYASAGSVKMQLTPLSGIDFSDASQIQMLIHSKGYFKASTDSWLNALEYSVNREAVICALGGLIGHMTRLMLHDALKNGEVLPYHVYKTCLRMDGQTLVNLEIFSNSFDGGPSGTLYKHLNHCVTASGKRLLRRWICHPLRDVDDINKRLDVVEGFILNCGLGPKTLEYLRKIPDLERLLGRVRSTVGLSSSVRLPFVGKKILKRRIKTFAMLIKGLRVGTDLLNEIQRGDHGVSALYKVVEIPALSSLRELIHQFEEAIQNEFPCDQDNDVKDDDDNTLAVLVDLFVGKAFEWSLVINAVSIIDVLRSFAAMTLLSFGTMCRPHILLKDGVPVLQMKGLWHPYAFTESANGLIPNDLSLGHDLSGFNRFALLLTGPNMGGKSTIMRATCLAIVLAQLGCYVPCQSCELTLADSIFTRLGATDRIMSGESTFLVECTETASVLQNATEDSLVLLDELGRGTSTFDGYAIAYAVFRHLVEKVRCRLLFATHYHPLTKEFASHPHVSLQHMACMLKPRSGAHGSNGEKELTFLYRLTSGACPESYGLQVATMAGLPKSIVEKASVAGQMMRSKIARNFKSSEQRAEFSTHHEEWLRTALAVSVKDGHLDEDIMDTLFCVSQELKAHFRKTS
ncbi:DNA mismatch repair protein MSH7 [Phragmites australis]|uniref:DNA mismatch repair protein MSH7 n=1 Tax=Phragmites australis TaxID=29695 RepID=UPI002D7A35D7|nr:DNA mismatch repair protein MSH7 [Phragmites australis]